MWPFLPLSLCWPVIRRAQASLGSEQLQEVRLGSQCALGGEEKGKDGLCGEVFGWWVAGCRDGSG
jgi:hypothetical protein